MRKNDKYINEGFYSFLFPFLRLVTQDKSPSGNEMWCAPSIDFLVNSVPDSAATCQQMALHITVAPPVVLFCKL